MARRASDSARESAAASAGVLLYRATAAGLRVLLAHPGGPFFTNKDDGSWTLPKGLINLGEDPADAALREFEEELGWRPTGNLVSLGEARLRSGKRVLAFSLSCALEEAELLARFSPGTFQMEWPPRSGRTAEFPEVDRIAFFDVGEAMTKLNAAQATFVACLVESAS